MSIAADEIRWQLAESARKRLEERGYVSVLDYGEVGHALFKHTGTGLVIEVKINVTRRTVEDDVLLFDPVLTA